jgi:DNA primase large subunit
MAVALDKKDLAKYPFLKEAHTLIDSKAYSLDTFLKGSMGIRIAQKASERISASISHTPMYDEIPLEFPEGEVLSYAIARVLVSCMNDVPLIDRLTRYEAERAYYFLQLDTAEIQHYVASQVGIDLEARRMNLSHYVELAAHLRDPQWKLVNRDISNGMIALTKEETFELLKERIRFVLRQQLPLFVPEAVCRQLQPAIDQISRVYQEKILEEFGSVEEDCFPPCIQALIMAITEGKNIPHTGRFALTSFLHTIGMDSHQIIEVFTRAPDFDVLKTQYQVEHISGRGGTEYTPPACATMLTYSLCVHRDKLCEEINHPLSYYRKKKKKQKKSAGTGAENVAAGGQHHDEEHD